MTGRASKRLNQGLKSPVSAWIWRACGYKPQGRKSLALEKECWLLYLSTSLIKIKMTENWEKNYILLTQKLIHWVKVAIEWNVSVCQHCQHNKKENLCQVTWQGLNLREKDTAPVCKVALILLKNIDILKKRKDWELTAFFSMVLEGQ